MHEQFYTSILSWFLGENPADKFDLTLYKKENGQK